MTNFSIWYFILALIALCLAYGYTMMRIERRRLEKETEETLKSMQNELNEILQRNRKALGDAAVDNICSDNP